MAGLGFFLGSSAPVTEVDETLQSPHNSVACRTLSYQCLTKYSAGASSGPMHFKIGNLCFVDVSFECFYFFPRNKLL